MKKRPFVKRFEYRVKHPYPFKRLGKSPLPEIWVDHVQSNSFPVMMSGVEFGSVLHLIEHRHIHGRKYQGEIPFPIMGGLIDSRPIEGSKMVHGVRFGIIDHFVEDGHFEECEGCDMPDACRDFGCAEKQGLKESIQY